MKKQIEICVPYLLAYGLILMFPMVSFAQGRSPEKEKGDKKELSSPGKGKQDARAKEQRGHEGHNHSNDGDAKGRPEGMKEEKGQTTRPEQEKPQGRKAEEGGDDKAKGKPDNKGNAYGKDKGGMSGKEFGQNRAAEARSKNQSQKAETKRTADEGEVRVREARERIKKAKEKLEKDKKEKRVNDKQYEERRKKIEEAEQEANELEGKIKIVKPQIEG